MTSPDRSSTEATTIAHVVRRLGMGASPRLTQQLLDRGATVGDAIDAALDLTAPASDPPAAAVPRDLDVARMQDITEQIAWWVGRMVSGERLIEERLVWFWTDHFATSRRKVPAPYLLWQQHLTIRRSATGSFADLLRDIARDPAMLLYLDGVRNAAGQPNENLARELMELHTLGEGEYSQTDVVEAARALTGWVIHVPGTPAAARVVAQPGLADLAPWESAVAGRRHDDGVKTILGSTANHDLDSTIDLLLDHPATASHIATKLYRELAGIDPPPDVVAELASTFRPDYEILPLVEAIVARPEFTSPEALRAKVASPLEKAMTLLQAFGGQPAADLGRLFRTTAYVPFLPPNPAGYPKGEELLGPYQFTHGLDLLWLVPESIPAMDTAGALATLGIHDPSPSTTDVVDRFADPHTKLGVALTAPEFVLT